MTIIPWRYFRFLVLISVSYVKDDLENYMIYMILTFKTSSKCDFIADYGSYLYYNAALSVLVVPVCSWITDRATRPVWVLQVALLLELGLEMALIIPSRISFTTVMVLQLARSAAHTQNYNSIWKLFKIKVSNDASASVGSSVISRSSSGIGGGGDSDGDAQSMGKRPLLSSVYGDDEEDNESVGDDVSVTNEATMSKETDIFSRIGISGIIGEVLIDVIVFSVCFVLLDRYNYSVHTVASVIYAATLATSALVVLIGASLTTSYLYNNNDSATLRPGDDPNNTVDELDTSFADRQSYFMTGLKDVFGTQLLRDILSHAVLLYVMWQLMWSAEPLTLASSSNTHDPDCSDVYHHLFEQAMFTNGLYAVCGVGFIMSLPYIKPLVYFERVYPIVAIVCLVCCVLLVLPLEYTVHMAMASVLAVVPWFLWRLDTFIAAAAVSPKYIGILTGVISAVRLVTPVLPGVLLKLHHTNVLVFIAIALLVTSMGVSWMVVSRNRPVLEALQARMM